MLMSVDSSLSYSSSTLSSPMTSPCSPDPTPDWPSTETPVTSSGIVNNASKIDEPVSSPNLEQQSEEDSSRKEWRQRREMALSFLNLTEKHLEELNLELKETAASLSLALSVKNDPRFWLSFGAKIHECKARRCFSHWIKLRGGGGNIFPIFYVFLWGGKNTDFFVFSEEIKTWKKKKEGSAPKNMCCEKHQSVFCIFLLDK